VVVTVAISIIVKGVTSNVSLVSRSVAESCSDVRW